MKVLNVQIKYIQKFCFVCDNNFFWQHKSKVCTACIALRQTCSKQAASLRQKSTSRGIKLLFFFKKKLLTVDAKATKEKEVARCLKNATEP